MRTFRVSIAIASALACTSAYAVDQTAFAKGYDMIPLNPPRVVSGTTSNLWKPGTTLYFKDNKQLQPVQTCENIFSEQPKTDEQRYGDGSFEDSRKSAFDLLLNLFAGLIEKVSGTVTANFSSDRDLTIKYAGLRSIATTDETLRSAQQKSTSGKLHMNEDCISTLQSEFYAKRDGAKFKLRFPVYVVRATGLADKVDISLNANAKQQLGVNAKITDYIEVKPELTHETKNNESIELSGFKEPIIWGIGLIAIDDLRKLGSISQFAPNVRAAARPLSKAEIDKLASATNSP